MTDVRFAPPTFAPNPSDDRALAASVSRLLADDYAVDAVIRESLASDWPGDVAGRLLLALSRLERLGAPTAERAAELCEAILEALDPYGCFGAPLGDTIDEQQVACHGWVVSGLLQRSEPRATAAALRIVDTLLLPALARLDTYPRGRRSTTDGAASGHLIDGRDGWRVSTDTWCVLLALNALVPAYLATERADIRGAITGLELLVDGLDVVAEGAQLHATLSAARALAQLAEHRGDASALHVARQVYAAYAGSARTLNAATFNWFGRPDSWTEPCAMVDALGLALALWRITGDDDYLRDAERIEHSALGFAQRDDGSFGLDRIATPEDPVIAVIHPDARWCCTMRGAVGLSEARESTARAEDGGVSIDLLHAGDIDVETSGGAWRVRLERSEDRWVLRLLGGPEGRACTVTLHAGRFGGRRLELRPTSPTCEIVTDRTPSETLLEDGRKVRYLGPDVLSRPMGGGGVDILRAQPRLGPPGEDAPRYELAW
ncbi:hypothetical protein [Agromyces mangrovi Wang et al. 2018]|uniref:hypothetical protein n=1 Tax=Agromyces mangrovi TaxID=1858653 RepID=UPI0025728D59|nr:hypothetical protein [Agromyces mangrovi]BDZ64425.1 hypothetical protein GCM10025877_13630 [Agromyces mangrovi]